MDYNDATMEAQNYTIPQHAALGWWISLYPVFIVVGILLFVPAGALHAALPASVSSALGKHGIKESAVSVLVRDLDTHSELLSHHQDTPRNPASVMKLLTTYAALDLLGPAYTWPTRYYLNGSLRDGVLDGDLVIKGQGDPYLVKEQFWLQLSALRELGLKTIKGNLLLDNSAFDLAAHDPAAFDRQPTRLYNVGPAATVVNFNASRFRIQPVDGHIRVLLDPPVPNIEIDNQLKSDKGPCRGPEGGWSIDVRQQQGKARVVFRGRYSARCGSHDLSRVVLDSDAYLYGIFTQLWRSLGGEFAGKYGYARVEEGALPFHTAYSKSLSEVVVGTNKFSNNLLARQLLLTIGYRERGQGTTVQDGVDAILAWLREQKLEIPGLVIENGSGLSRRISITAAGLGNLLLHAAGSPYQPEFQSSFPLIGMDGTMKTRLNDMQLGGRVRLKTGYVKGVRTLAGYVRADSGRDYAVVLFISDGKVRYGNGNAIQDAFIRWVLRHG